MLDINKQASSIVNKVFETGESAFIYKHGKPIAEIRRLSDPLSDERKAALDYLVHVSPISVEETIETVLDAGRQRGV